MVVHVIIPALGRQKKQPYQPWLHGESLSEMAGHEKPGCQVSGDERRRKYRGPVLEGPEPHEWGQQSPAQLEQWQVQEKGVEDFPSLSP